MTTTTDTNLPIPAGATTDGWKFVDNNGVLLRSLEWSFVG
jgi:hypothetical protein